jgi:hypothetical protein
MNNSQVAQILTAELYQQIAAWRDLCASQNSRKYAEIAVAKATATQATAFPEKSKITDVLPPL